MKNEESPQYRKLEIAHPEKIQVRMVKPQELTTFSKHRGNAYSPNERLLYLLDTDTQHDQPRQSIGYFLGKWLEFGLFGNKPEVWDEFLSNVLASGASSYYRLDVHKHDYEAGHYKAKVYYFDEPAIGSIKMHLETHPIAGNTDDEKWLKIYINQLITASENEEQALLLVQPDVKGRYCSLVSRLFSFAANPESLKKIDNAEAVKRHEFTHVMSHQKWDEVIYMIFQISEEKLRVDEYFDLVSGMSDEDKEPTLSLISDMQMLNRFMTGLLESEAIVYEVLGEEPMATTVDIQNTTLKRFYTRMASVLYWVKILNSDDPRLQIDSIFELGRAKVGWGGFAGFKTHDVGTLILVFSDRIQIDRLREAQIGEGLGVNKLLEKPLEIGEVIDTFQDLIDNPELLVNRIQQGLFIVEDLQRSVLEMYYSKLVELSGKSDGFKDSLINVINELGEKLHKQK